MAHRFVGARGVRFHVAEAGAGPPVLLLHGFPQHWYALGLERGRLIATPWPWRSPGWAPGPPARARAGTALHRQYALRDIVPVLAAGTAPSGSPCPPRILAGADDFGLVVRAALDLLER